MNQILNGLIGGLAYSLAGLANKSKREKFNWKKMAPTLIVAAIIGGIAGATNQDYGVVANGAMAAGLTAVIEKSWKPIYQKLQQNISIIFNKIFKQRELYLFMKIVKIKFRTRRNEIVEGYFIKTPFG